MQKGWPGKDGKAKEKIIDVVWSGDRKPGTDDKLPPVGNAVDLKTATYTNTIGSPSLMGNWTDNEFNPGNNILYYVRILEIPTPRWTTYDAVRNNLPLLQDVPGHHTGARLDIADLVYTCIITGYLNQAGCFTSRGRLLNCIENDCDIQSDDFELYS